MKTLAAGLAALCLFFTTSCGVKSLTMGKASPEMDEAFKSYINATDSAKVNIQSVMVIQHGKILEQKWMNGGDPDSVHTMWSVSKTFTAMAVGLAIDEGKLRLDDRLVSFYPDFEVPDSNFYLKTVTVRDLLTMTCGHDKEPARESDSLTAEQLFLSAPIKHIPGSFYLYNSMGTYMLSCIVSKVTGQKVNDYLEDRLWKPLGIEKPVWDESPEGYNWGGWGLHLKTIDMAKAGVMLLDKGKWNGKQVIPESWVSEMSRWQTWSKPSGWPIKVIMDTHTSRDNNDWLQGYGYQMWLCRHGAFRADGAHGQFIFIFPDKDAVIVNTAMSDAYQGQIDLMWKYLYPAL